MMAKMFYTLEEAKAALGKSEDEIKQYAREGRLREFRDGPRLMFKADQVEQLKGEMIGAGSSGSGLDQVDLGTSDSGGLIGLVDTTGASGTSITLSDTDAGGTGSGMKLKDDTSLTQDLGLSGSLGGVPSPGRPGSGSGIMGGTGSPVGSSPSGTGLSGSFGGKSGPGINVFGAEDVVERADPSAQTAISGGIREQMELQGVGSGSGLLDLTRESDDTSLGAVLDEITPGGSAAGLTGAGLSGAGLTGAGLTGAGMSGTGITGVRPPALGGEALGAALAEEAATPRMASAPVYVQAPDPMAPAFGGAALGAAIFVFFGIFALISSVMGNRPDAVAWFGVHKQNMNLFLIAVIGLVVVAVGFVIGMITGKVARR
jgi:hypothetical protein